MLKVSLAIFYLFHALSAQFICNDVIPQGLTVAIQQAVTPMNFLSAPFKVGDYNDKLSTYYTESQSNFMKMNYSDDTIAFVFAFQPDDLPSQPEFAVATLMPAIINKLSGCIDPYTMHYLEANKFNNEFNLPYVAIQVAGHVAGLAYFYHPAIIENPPADWATKNVFGTSHHPEYEENIWFQGIVVFSELQDSNYPTSEAANHIGSEEDIIAMLNRVNAAFASFTGDENE